MPEKTHRYNILMPIELWKRIKELAKRNRRHTSQEIFIAIENHLKQTHSPEYYRAWEKET